MVIYGSGRLLIIPDIIYYDIIDRVEACRKKAKSMLRILKMLKKESVVAIKNLLSPFEILISYHFKIERVNIVILPSLNRRHNA